MTEALPIETCINHYLVANLGSSYHPQLKIDIWFSYSRAFISKSKNGIYFEEGHT